MTMTLISTAVVGAGGAASIEFVGIPADADDLLLVLSGRTSGTFGEEMRLRFNGLATSFTSIRLRGSGSAVNTGGGITSGLVGYVTGAGATASTFGNLNVYIPNYASSSNKSFSGDSVTENNATSAYQTLVAGVWANTSAITAIQLIDNGNDFVQYSTASLYKITKA